MGTPEFAVPSLLKLIEAGYSPVAVVTAPDKPAGRGLQLKSSPVKEAALKAGIPVLQPVNLKAPEFLEQLKIFYPDVQFVVAFRMLPEAVWNLPPLGTFNLHASLLPQYRGAAPINHAIINGESQTGLTTFKLRHQIDTGEIAFQQTLDIGLELTAGELHDVMMVQGADLVEKTIKAIENNTLVLHEQKINAGVDLMHEAPKLHPAFCKIDFNSPALTVHNKIRGLSPFPGATTELVMNNKIQPFKLLRTKLSDFKKEGAPGELDCSQPGRMFVCCQDNWLELLEIQPAGKKRMTVQAFLNGFKPEGTPVFA